MTNIEKILKLAMEVQKETDFCVFIDMSGHVNWLKVSIKESKKKYGEDVIDLECPVGKATGMYEGTRHSTKRELSIIHALKKILKTGRFNATRYACKNKLCVRYRDEESGEYLKCSGATHFTDVSACRCRLKKLKI